jgi:hypothetical protein
MQMRIRSVLCGAAMILFNIIAFSVTSPCGAATGTTVPSSTALPVRFVHSVDARKANPGDQVVAKLLQTVVSLDGLRVPKGALVIGHVVDAQPFHLNREPYAEQKASVLSIHFDHIVNGDVSTPVNLSVRALANSIESYEAAYPHRLDETDGLGTMDLIGGDEFSPLDKTIRDSDGQMIGFNRKNGVFARLIASDDTNRVGSPGCNATDSEQSMAIFSPSACGTYGFEGVSMRRTGRRGSGMFTLESHEHSVKLNAGSTALLQETKGH